MNKVKELFGIHKGTNTDLEKALKEQLCPYSHKKCYKTRKSDPQIAIGTCSVEYGDGLVIICPNRLRENNLIFIDCLHLLALHEPGNELYVLPEVSVPGGNVDFFLVSSKAGKVKDFIGIELQTMDTTGTVWPERQRFLYEYGFAVNERDIRNARSFGMNWKMTAKTILVQMQHKSEMFEKLNKHLVLVIQEPFYEYIKQKFSFSHIQGVRVGDPIHIHSYSFKERGNSLRLSLDTRVSTDFNGILQCLGLKTQVNVKLEEIITRLQEKLDDEYRLVVG